MREIKFRAWDKQANKWRHVSDIGWYRPETGKIGISGVVAILDDGRDQFMPIEDVDVVDFTGLKDKNGKEIYEGDFLVETDDSEPLLHRIVWCDEAKFELETLEDEEGHWGAHNIDLLADLDMKEFHVIGNIYENPELLK